MCNTSQSRLLVLPRYMPRTGTDPLHRVTESIAVLQTVRESAGGDYYMSSTYLCVIIDSPFIYNNFFGPQVAVVIKCILHC